MTKEVQGSKVPGSRFKLKNPSTKMKENQKNVTQKEYS